DSVLRGMDTENSTRNHGTISKHYTVYIPRSGERETVERTGKAKRTTWRSMYSSRNIFRSFVHRVYLEPWLLPISLGDDACISSTEQSRPWSVASFRVFAVVQKVTCSTLLRSTQDSI